MQVTLRHEGTGDVKLLAAGWSWALFLGAGFFGLPLFFRGLAGWGCVMLVAWAFRLAIPHLGATPVTIDTLEWLHTAVVTSLAAFLGAHGNALSIEHYRACGYRSAIGRDSLDHRVAAQLWEQ